MELPDIPRTKMIVVGVVAVLLLIVLFQNRQSVETHVLFFTIAMPRAFLLIITAARGFTAGVVVSLMYFKKP